MENVPLLVASTNFAAFTLNNSELPLLIVRILLRFKKVSDVILTLLTESTHVNKADVCLFGYKKNLSGENSISC